MRWQGRTTDEILAEIAGVRHGVVTRRELLAAGVSAGQVERRVRSGALLVEFRGVYRVGHRAPSREAHYAAAVAACGDGSALRNRAAAHLQALIRGPALPPEVMTRSERRIDGILTWRSRRIDPRETTVVNAIPVTTVPRTLVDLAAVLDEEALARACHEAGVLYGTTPAQVEEVLGRHPGSPGAGRLRAVLRGDVRVTLSTLERSFLIRLRAERLPLPETNCVAGSRRVDCRWPMHRVTVELDGYRYHHSRHAWEQDRAREREARARGDEFRRFTYADVFEDPRYLLRELRSLLGCPA